MAAIEFEPDLNLEWELLTADTEIVFDPEEEQDG